MQQAWLSAHHTCRLPEPPRCPRRAAVSTPPETRDGQGPGQGHRARAGLVSSEAVFQPPPRPALRTFVTLPQKPRAGSCPDLGHGHRRGKKWNPARLRDRPDFQETSEGLLGGHHGGTVALTASGVGEVQVTSAWDGAVSHLGKSSHERGPGGGVEREQGKCFSSSWAHMWPQGLTGSRWWVNLPGSGEGPWELKMSRASPSCCRW